MTCLLCFLTTFIPIYGPDQSWGACFCHVCAQAQAQEGEALGANITGLAMPRLTDWLKALGISLPARLSSL
jgi:hypothetical protein